MPRAQVRLPLAFLHDAVMAAASFALALYLRYGAQFYIQTESYFTVAVALFTLIAMTSFIVLRTQKGLWRYASLQDLTTLVKASTLAILVFYVLLFFLNRLEGLPRSVPFLHWILLVALVGAPRILYRMWKDGGLSAPSLRRAAPNAVPVLLVGATNQAELFLRDTQRDPSAVYRVVGIIDNAPINTGRKMRGITIYGPLGALARVIDKLGHRSLRPQRLILADEHLDKPAMQQLLADADALGIGLSRLPRLVELKDNTERLSVRPVAIEDLLGRAQATHDRDALRGFIAGRRVMVTGAGGTIGSELARQIAGYGPSHLTLLDNSEYNLYQIDAELRGLAQNENACAFQTLLADVRDGDAIDRIFALVAPELVFHAAAIKHVPIAEDNAEEAVLTNVIGTRVVADAAARHGTASMVLISTDKAVNPSSVMGATKRLAECVCQALGERNEGEQIGGSSPAMKFTTVRFGNVLGSTGSVVPLFQKQLEQGGPLTVTHKDMVRYFMTVREAVELVLQAARLGAAEAQPPIFVLDMGDPVRIEDLALQMIRLAGLRPHEDIQIVYTGLRPGEKLFEELFHDAESLVPTAQPGILRAKARAVTLGELALSLEALEGAARSRDAESVRALLHAMVPEFTVPEFTAPAFDTSHRPAGRRETPIDIRALISHS